MNLLKRYRAWRKEQARIKARINEVFNSVYKQTKITEELVKAINDNSFTLASKLRTQLDNLPCAVCGRGYNE